MNITKGKPPSFGFPELRGTIEAVKFPAFAEIKLDGELTFLIFKRMPTGDCFICTVNKYGTTRMDFPALNQYKERFDRKGYDHLILIGELFSEEGKLGALYSLLSKKTTNDVNLSLFDILAFNNQSWKENTLLDRKEKLVEILGKNFVLPKVVHSKEEALEYFERVTKLGYEGVVIKEFSGTFKCGPCSWVKLKYKDKSNYKVINIDKTLERMDVMVNTPMFPDGKLVGVKLCNKYKSTIKEGDFAIIEHQGILSVGGLRHPVFKGVYNGN